MTAVLQDPQRRERTLWFLTVNVMSLFIAVGLFLAILYGDGLSLIFEPFMLALYEYKSLVIAIALSPLFASLLVGMAYAKRAIKRKRAQAEAQGSV